LSAADVLCVVNKTVDCYKPVDWQQRIAGVMSTCDDATHATNMKLN